MYIAKVFILLKHGVKDSQGAAVGRSLGTLGFTTVDSVRIGKYIEVDLTSKSKKDADSETKKMCDKLLANLVIERYSYTIHNKKISWVQQISLKIKKMLVKLKEHWD